jgi:hypothetical protein
MPNAPGRAYDQGSIENALELALARISQLMTDPPPSMDG